MQIFSEISLGWADYLLLLGLIVALPIEGEISMRRDKPALIAGLPGAREKLYRSTIWMLLFTCGAVLLVWVLSHRGWTPLGFQIEVGMRALAGWSLAALAAGVVILQYYQVRTSQAAAAKVNAELEGMGDVLHYIPATRGEYRLFALTGLTAGITEEIIFRGYLIWAFGHFAPLWAAALLSLALFIFLHRYQGLRGMAQVAVIGGILTAVYLLSGSLWPAILLHIIVDIANNATVWAARRVKPA